MSDILLSVDGDLRPLESKLNRISSKTINLNLKDSISQPLGRITGKVSEFDKSLEASNARVLAFGASAGAVYALGRAFKDIVASTIEVEKSIADINVVLNASTQSISKFTSGLFNVAKNTGQSFSEVAKAATELARQGLGVEETLKRTNDALILTRLSGLDAATSVEALTAAVNSFARAGLTTTEVINKLATVDAAFAVSTADLANAISRVGSTAQDVGVDIDQLIAIVTAAQQTTARGGAVIGNSLKTIFTRLQRTDTLDALQGIGIAVKDLQGNTLPAVQILKNLSDVFYQLGDAQRAQVAETVGGVFQINILRAALGDLSKEFSVYDSALKTSTSATNQAIQRNEALNQTLSALVNKTFVNLKEAAAGVGEITIAPTIKTGLGGLNNLLESFNKPKESQGAGVKVAQGILEGLGNYLSGPGLAVIAAVFLKIFGRLTSFSAEALKSLLGIASQTDRIAEAQSRVNAILAQNPGLIQAIISKEATLLQVENQILKVIQAQNAARSTAATISASVSPKVAGVGGARKTKAFGFVPNFSAEMQEVMGAQMGGYRAGNIKKMNIPGEGNIVYNSAESVVKFPGASQPAIIPPENSKAGKDYKKQFEKEAGFNPYAAKGFIPNFAKQQAQRVDASKFATMLVPQGSKGIGEYTFLNKQKQPVANVTWPIIPLGNKYKDNNVMTNISERVEKVAADLMVGYASTIKPPARDFSAAEIANKINGAGGAKGSLRSFAGAVFEAGTNLALDYRAATKEGLDFDVIGGTQNLRELFPGFNTRLADYKINATSSDNRESMARKILKARGLGYMTKEGEFDPNRTGQQLFTTGKRKMRQKRPQDVARSQNTLSKGFIPNFSALQEAIQREKDAGVAASIIRVGVDDSLMSKNNPYGLGVYNTKDEPAGLKQGINRSKSKGFIPNFAPLQLPGPAIEKNTQAFDKNTKKVEVNAETNNKSVDKISAWQGKLLAASFALEAARGVISQFSDTTSETSKNLSSLVTALSSVTTGLAIGGRGGKALAGGMLLTQGYFMNEERKNAPYTSQIDQLGKSLDAFKEKNGQLESVISKITPLINSYSEELDQAVPDQSKIQDFRKGILDAIADLPVELKNQVLQQFSGPALSKETPRNISNVLAKEQTGIINQANITQLTQSLIQKQLQTKQAEDAAGGFLGINKLMSRFTEQPIDYKPEDPFANKDFASATSQTLLNNILSQPGQGGPEGLAKIAETLSPAAGNINQFVDALQSLSGKSKETEEAFKNLRSVLGTNDQAAKTLSKSILDNVGAMIKAGQERIKIPGGERFQKQENYKGIGKFYSPEDFITPEQGSQFGLEMYGATELYRRAKESGDQTEMGRSAGRILQLQYQRGSSLEELQSAAPELLKQFQETIKNQIDQEIQTMQEGFTSAGVPIDVSKLRKNNFKPEDAAKNWIQETFAPRDNSLGKMGTEIIDTFTPAVQQAQTELNLLTEAAKKLKEIIDNIDKAPSSQQQFKETGAQNITPEAPSAAQVASNVGGGALVGANVGQIFSKIPKYGKYLQALSALLGGGGGYYFGGGTVPNFAKTDIDKAIELEQNITGKKAMFSTIPIPHVRNSSQPSFNGAISQHGGLKKALQDSQELQNSIPNFAVEPGTEAYNSLERLAQENTPEGKAAKAKLESINRKYKGQASGKVPLSLPAPKNSSAGPLPGISKVEKQLSVISKQLPKIPGPLTKLGKGFGPLTSALLAAPQYQEYKNQGYDSLDAGLLTAGSFIGGTLGGALGGAAGTAVAPGVGTAVGAVGGAIGGSLLAEEMMKALIDDQKIKPKIDPKNYKDSRKPSRPKTRSGTLMIDPGDGTTETTVGETAKNFRPQNTSDMFQFPMQSFNFDEQGIPEISAKEPSKFEKLKNIYRGSEKINSTMGGDSRIDTAKLSIPKELMEGMTEEQQFNAQKMSLEKIISENASAPGYNPTKDYGTSIAPYKREIDELEGGRARRGNTPGTIGMYERTRQKQMNKGFSSKEQRLSEQRRTGLIDSGFEKGYAQYGLNGKLAPEAQVTARNYNSETGMVMNKTSEGAIGLESEIRQKEKDIFLNQASKRYAEQAKERRLKTAQTGEIKPNLPGQAANAPIYKEGTDTNLTKEDIESGNKMAKDLMGQYLNQKGKDKYGRTGFQNLQANNRMNAPNIAAPTFGEAPTFMAKDNLPMYGQNLQAPLLFGTKQNTDQTASLENQDFINNTQSFDNTKGYSLNSSRQVQSNMPFAQYNNPQEYMPPSDFFQPKTTLENQLAASQNAPLLTTPMAGTVSTNKNINMPQNNMIQEALTPNLENTIPTPTTSFPQPKTDLENQLAQSQSGGGFMDISQDSISRFQAARNFALSSPYASNEQGPENTIPTPTTSFPQPKTDLENQLAQSQSGGGFMDISQDSISRFQAARNFALSSPYASNEQGPMSLSEANGMVEDIPQQNPLTANAPDTRSMFNTNTANPAGLNSKLSYSQQNPLNTNQLDSNMTYKDKKTGFMVSPTQEELGGGKNKLNMQSEPKDKSLEQADSLNQQISTITESFSKLSEITKTFSETLSESSKKMEESSKNKSESTQGGQEQQKEGGQSGTIKVEPVTASVSVQTSPNTETEAKIAAIEAVIKELKTQLEGVKQKITGNVNPPKR